MTRYTYDGLRLHLLLAWPGVITAAVLAPASEADRAGAPQLLTDLTGRALRNKGYCSPARRTELGSSCLDLIAPPRGKKPG